MGIRHARFVWNIPRPAAISTLLLVVFFLSACATVPLTNRRQFSLIPEAEIRALSSRQYQDIVASSVRSTDTRQAAMLEKVGTQIARTAEDFVSRSGVSADDFEWEFTLLEDAATVNAFALPGGKIAVYNGILPYTQDEAGLAAVVAHEIAHVIARHGTERMSQILLADMGTALIARRLDETDEKTRTYIMLAFGATVNLGIVLPYSRLHEREADRIGLILMAKAGYDPQAAVYFWQRMSAQQQSSIPQFLSTHPAPESRIRDIEAAIPEARQYAPHRVP